MAVQSGTWANRQVAIVEWREYVAGGGTITIPHVADAGFLRKVDVVDMQWKAAVPNSSGAVPPGVLVKFPDASTTQVVNTSGGGRDLKVVIEIRPS